MTTESDVAGFVAKFAPEMQEQITACRRGMRRRFPDAVELVYDNYNFLVFGFGPTPRPSEAVFSMAAGARGIRLFFLQRALELPDPHHLLGGSGTKVRNLPLPDARELERAEVTALMEAACALASIPMTAAQGPAVVVRSISAKQRPRR